MSARGLILALCLAGPLSAADLATDMSIAGFETKEAFDALSDPSSGRNPRITGLKNLIAAQDETLAILREAQRRLGLMIKERNRALMAKRQILSQSIAALSTIERSQTPSLLLNPEGASGTAQTVTIIDGLVPVLTAQIPDDEDQLMALQKDMQSWSDHYDTLFAFRREAQETVIELSTAPAPRLSAIPAFKSAAGSLANMSAFDQATDALASSFRDYAELNTAEETPLLGQMIWPVETLSPPTTKTEGLGATRREYLILNAPGFSRLKAPITGTVLYAGSFDASGQLVMIEPARDVLVLISGHHQTSVQTGSMVDKGDLIGVIGRSGSQGGDLLSYDETAHDKDTGQRILVEVRLAGDPDDPMQWFELEERESTE
ncbi:MAG: peptidoglycan DD-metalloendopeptidase family protein [Pseudomonadota bacterium]